MNHLKQEYLSPTWRNWGLKVDSAYFRIWFGSWWDKQFRLLYYLTGLNKVLLSYYYKALISYCSSVALSWLIHHVYNLYTFILPTQMSCNLLFAWNWKPHGPQAQTEFFLPSFLVGHASPVITTPTTFIIGLCAPQSYLLVYFYHKVQCIVQCSYVKETIMWPYSHCSCITILQYVCWWRK